MTVPSTSIKAGPFDGNDVASAFPFTFPCFAVADLRVVEAVVATGVETDLVLDSGYSVTLNADQEVSPGGTVTYKVGGVTTPLPSTKKLVILSDVENAQPTALPNGGAWRPKVVERALDRLTLQIKQLEEALARVFKVDVTSDSDVDTLLSSVNAKAAEAVAAASAADASADLAAALVTGLNTTNITALKALPKTGPGRAFVAGYYAAGDGGGGSYYYDAADTTSADNGGTIIVATDGGRWKLTDLDSVSLHTFGARGDGTSAVTAYNRAVAWINSTGKKVNIHDGTYLIDAATNPITVNNGFFQGSGDSAILSITYTGSAFRWGDNASSLIVGGGMRDVTISYPSAPAGGAIALDIRNASRQEWTGLQVQNVNTLARLGNSASYPVSIQRFLGLTGYVYNSGAPTFDINYGAGFFIDDTQLYVAGVAMPVHPASMTTVTGTNFLDVRTGSWDTIIVGENVLAERYDVGLSVYAASGVVINNIWLNAAVFDFCKTYGVLLYSDTGGIIVGLHAGEAWLVAWDGVGLSIDGPGTNTLHKLGKPRIGLCGGSGIYIGAACTDWSLDSPHIYATNRLGGSSPAVDIRGGKFTWTGGVINPDVSGVGLPYRAPYGVSILSDVDDYTITGVNAKGSTGGWSIGANAAGSKNRLVSRNPNANYAGVKTGGIYAVPASNVAWTNTTPLTHQVTIRGGTVTGLAKNGTNLTGATTADLTIEPGETFTVTYSSAPSITWFAMP